MEEITFDLEAMTLGELDDIGEIVGEAALEEMMAGKMRPKGLIAVAYVVKRRDNPEFTLEDARALKVMALKQPDAVGKGNGNGA